MTPDDTRHQPGRSGLGLASRSQTYVRMAAIGAALLFVGLIVPIVVGDPVADQVTAGSSSFDDDFGIQADELDDEEVADGTSSDPLDGGDLTGDPTTASTIAGGSTAGGGAVAGGSSDGGAAAPTTGGGAGTAGGGGAPAPAGSGGQDPGSAPLTATDRGVTAEVIRVGMLILDIGPVGRAGVAVDVDAEQQQAAWQAAVDQVNEAGGIHGRQIEPYYAKYDVLSDDSMRRACLALTQDAQVFIVLGGFSKPAHSLCVIEEHKTPLISYISYTPDSLFRRGGGLLFTTFPSAERMLRNWIHELDRLGAIGSKKIGIVTDDQTDPGYESAPQLEQYAREAGHDVVHLSKLAGTASSQVPVEVQQMRSKGVELILMMAGTLNSQAFSQSADQQQWKPAWSTSDWATGYGDSTYRNSGESFDGAINITSARNYDVRGNIPPTEPAKACEANYEAQTGRQLAPPGEAEWSLTMNFCDTFRVFAGGAGAAGPELTRAKWGQAAQQLGALQMAAVGHGDLRPGKFSVTNEVRTQRWQLDCRCWTYVDPWRQARY